MIDWSFVYHRYVHNERIVNGYKYQFQPFGGGECNEPYYEKMLLNKNDCLVDVGANCGGWTIPAAKYYRQVHAFEANPQIVKVLKTNLAKNGIHNVTVYSYGLGEEERRKLLWLYPKTGQDSFLQEHTGLKSKGEAVNVQLMRLDSFLLAPSAVKIDTEGYEIQVLQGAMKTIMQHKPVLLVETHDENDVSPIKQIFQFYKWELLKRHQPDVEQTIMIGRPEVF